MLWVPAKGKILVAHNTATVGGSPIGTSVTTGASSSTKGTAVQLIASTAFDAYWVQVICTNYALSGASSQGCVDILTGSATEEVLIPNLLMGHCGNVASTTDALTRIWQFPLYIPAGTRLAAQAAGERTSTAMRVIIYLYGGHGLPPFRVGSKVTTYGVTVPVGTTIAPGASGAEGAWAQITASTSEDHFALVPSFQLPSNITITSKNYAVDVGMGSATEEEIGQSFWYSATTTESMGGPINPMPIFQDIPAGTRLVMRASNSGTNDTGNYNGALHGVS